MATINIDIDDFIYELSDYEKQELIDSLYSDGITPSNITDVMTPTVYSETELKTKLYAIWENRIFITNDDLESLTHYAKKGDYEN